jgi:hypothetical protein
MDREIYRDRLARRECVQCAAPLETDQENVRCTLCSERKRDAEHALRDNRRANRLCIGCGAVELKTKLRCVDCVQIQKNSAREMRERFEREGLCVTACGRPVVPGKRRCQICLDKECANYKQSKAARLCSSCRTPVVKGTKCDDCKSLKKDLKNDRVARGLCEHSCGRSRLSNARKCEQHYFEQAAARHLDDKELWKDLQSLWIQQEGLCFYTGLPITLGVDADVDHVKPIAKGGANDITNLVWSSRKFNFLKRDLDLDELADLCRRFLTKAGLLPK